MSDKPISFSAPMVKALIAGQKIQTRRALNPQPSAVQDVGLVLAENPLRIQVGDRLWVKEVHGWMSGHGWRYRADHEYLEFIEDGSLAWRSPRFMPKRASRITLTVTDVRVQRLHDISKADAIAEGIELVRETWQGKHWRNYGAEGFDDLSAVYSYRTLWNYVNGHTGAAPKEIVPWSLNPWVAAYTFSVSLGNIDSLPHAEGYAYTPLGREARNG